MYNVWCPNIERSALEQIANLQNHPVIKHIAIMPDCHCGYGVPIGSVIACKNAVIPNAVGVDISCGMISLATDINVASLDKSLLRQIINDIKSLVPAGEGQSNKECGILGDHYFDSLQCKELKDDDNFIKLSRKNIGTLGGGNHFIELQKDESDCLNIMIHCGSRNFGYRIAKYYNAMALNLNKKWHSCIPDDSLAFLPTDDINGQSYIKDTVLANEYAALNREIILQNIIDVFTNHFQNITFCRRIHINHNFLSKENHFGENFWIHRKGATAAKLYQFGIIPGSMGTKSYIVQGLGNSLSMSSCSHGAGRIMSRTEASNSFIKQECEEKMDGIVWDGFKKRKRRKENDPKYDLGETPQAYKDIDEVIEAQKDLVEVVAILRPIAVIKG